MPKKKKPVRKVVDSAAKARRIARKVVGQVPSSKVIVPKSERAPKHKKPVGVEEE
jgi:hypothetical protein